MLTANTHDTTHKEILTAAKLGFQIAKGSLVINGIANQSETPVALLKLSLPQKQALTHV